MKKDKIWHYVWLVGIYVILFIILYLVIQYKVKWQGRDLSDYLYFYNCSSQICTSSESINNYYSSIKCSNNGCPIVKEIKDDLVIINSNKKEYIYNYASGKVINDTYQTYKFLDNGYIVMDKDNNYGIIDEVGEIVEEIKYREITGYKDGYITYLENGKKGIINEKKNINIKPIYEDIVLINDSIYAYLEDNKYYIASYDTELPVNDVKYDYLYDIDNNSILIIKDRKIDIVNNNLKSNLILKLETYYTYQEEQERGSLKFKREGNFLTFNVVQDNNQINKYIYDIRNKKLYS